MGGEGEEVICSTCKKDKLESEFYARSDRPGLRPSCKVCLSLMQRVKKMSAKFPVKWPPAPLSWLTPITPYIPDQECSIMEQPSHEYKVHTVIADPASTAEDDEQSND